jgi:hypothetical protein
VTHANPINLLAPANFLQNAVERATHDTAGPRHAGRDQSFDKRFPLAYGQSKYCVMAGSF